MSTHSRVLSPPRNRPGRKVAAVASAIACGLALLAYFQPHPPAIVLTTLAGIALIQMLATVIGRAWTRLLPTALQGGARFYVAPALGLATVVVVSGMFGYFSPFGNTRFLPLLICCMLAAALACEHRPLLALQQGMLMAGFGLVCGISIVLPLLLYGGFDPVNDAFTYLAHAQWLQQHAFSDIVSRDALTPLNTQIYIYQDAGLRMGGSYLLAMLQALTQVRWAYEIYPAVLVSAISACCLAAGFAMMRQLRRIGRAARLALLLLPALTVGGLTFGAAHGFMPQTLGLAMASGILFLNGPVLRKLARSDGAPWAGLKAAVPSAIMIAALAQAYTELAPFVLLALAVGGIVLAGRLHAWRKIISYGAIMVALLVLLLNTDLYLEYRALRIQAGVVVGTPVEWSLLGFVAHAFGAHGGAWADFQWSVPGTVEFREIGLGLALLAAMTVPVAASLRPLWRAVVDGPLLPAVMALLFFWAALLFFRYAVPSPFPTGVGQSWSQAKLSDWAHPFALALTVFSLATLRARAGARWFGAALAGIGLPCLIGAAFFAVAAVAYFSQRTYAGIADLSRFYGDLRAAVWSGCPEAAPVFLDLPGKMLEMPMLYLADRDVQGNWKSDPYFYELADQRSLMHAKPGSCVIEAGDLGTIEGKGSVVGPYVVHMAPSGDLASLKSIEGAYARESDREHWWYWVKQEVRLDISPARVPARLKLEFEHVPVGEQNFTMQIAFRDGSSKEILFSGHHQTAGKFETVIDARSSAVSSLRIRGDGKPARLAPNDGREASWMLRDIKLSTLAAASP